jgi:hypothetical protein
MHAMKPLNSTIIPKSSLNCKGFKPFYNSFLAKVTGSSNYCGAIALQLGRRRIKSCLERSLKNDKKLSFIHCNDGQTARRKQVENEDAS